MQNKTGLILFSILLAGIFLLQLYYLAEAFYPRSQYLYDAQSSYIVYTYRTLMFLIIAVLIWMEVDRLEHFHIDKFTLTTFILGSILRWRLGIAGEGYFLILIGLGGISIIFVLTAKKPNILKTDLRWALIGVAAGGVLLIPITYLGLLLRETWSLHPLLRDYFTLTAISQTFAELTSGALLEEILFRGFLWGYLKRQNWEEKKIIWTQGLLFWFSHFGRILTPFTFFVSIPLLICLSSVLTLRSKQVFPAILSHAVINAASAGLNLAAF